jgi:hypothetical protein
MANNFKVGDIVTKQYGKKTAEITYEYAGYQNRGGYYSCRYTQSKHSFSSYGTDLKLYEGETEQMAETKTLYSFTKDDGTVAYGTHIGTNSSNQYLIEEKVTGQIHVLDKKNLEEVLPYTFSAKMGTSENHYVGTPGTVKKGDILLYTGSSTPQIAVVTGIDTKNKSARSKFKGAKIVTEEI